MLVFLLSYPVVGAVPGYMVDAVLWAYPPASAKTVDLVCKETVCCVGGKVKH